MTESEIRAAIAASETATAALRALLPENATAQLTVGGLLPRYMASPKFKGLKAIETESRRLCLHIAPYFGAIQVSDLTHERLEAYRAMRKKQPGNGGKGTTKPATRNRELLQLSAMLSWAEDAKLIPKNPIRPIPLEAENNQRQTCPDPADVNRILVACTTRLRAMVAVAFWCGLRRAEICAIEEGQIVWDEGLIVLRGPQTKTGRPRITIFPDRASRAVESYLAQKRSEKVDSRTLFATASGRQISPRNFLRDFHAAADAAGVKAAPGERLWLHDLRSGLVGLQLELGTPERVVMDMTGHSTHAAFDRYVRVKRRWLVEARERVEEFATRKGPQSKASKQNGELFRNWGLTKVSGS